MVKVATEQDIQTLSTVELRNSVLYLREKLEATDNLNREVSLHNLELQEQLLKTDPMRLTDHEVIHLSLAHLFLERIRKEMKTDPFSGHVGAYVNVSNLVRMIYRQIPALQIAEHPYLDQFMADQASKE